MHHIHPPQIISLRGTKTLLGNLEVRCSPGPFPRVPAIQMVHPPPTFAAKLEVSILKVPITVQPLLITVAIPPVTAAATASSSCSSGSAALRRRTPSALSVAGAGWALEGGGLPGAEEVLIAGLLGAHTIWSAFVLVRAALFRLVGNCMTTWRRARL